MSARLVLGVAATMLCIVVCAVLLARGPLGYRLTPLMQPHPRIEYLLKPDQDVRRFSQHIQVNAWGMRSAGFPARRSDSRELRVLVFGDSVVSAVGFTTQERLATTLLQQRLATPDRPVVVANVAAGSWGPGNWLAYAREYGFFDADVVVLVASGHDQADNREFPAMPVHPRPIPEALAPAVEFVAIQRAKMSRREVATLESARASPVDVRVAMTDLARLLMLARTSVPNVSVVLHPEKGELYGAPHPGRVAIEALCRRLGVKVIRPDADYRAAIERGLALYHDSIHPTDAGQAVLASVIERELAAIHAN